MAIERALLYDVCQAVEDPTERAGCELDKALVISSPTPEQTWGSHQSTACFWRAKEGSSFHCGDSIV